jgi:hypothetical protein
MGILNKMQSKQKILLVGMVLIFFSACYYDKKDQVYPQVIVTTCDTTNVTYSTTVTGILNANCISCHGSSANSLGGGIVLNTYATLKPYVTNGNLVNSILQNGKVPSMPLNMPKIDDCSINKIVAWVNKGAINN